MIEERSAWRSRFGFYIASIGTAIGLGNLWRFPYVATEYGGGAFIFLYVLMAFFIGIPLIISEISLGKYIHKKGLTISELIGESSFKFAPILKILMWLPYLISFVVLAYYCVLSGWTLHLLVQTLVNLVFGNNYFGESVFLSLKNNIFLQLSLSSVHLIIVLFIATKGLKVGIEKWLSFVMPFFFCFLLYISFKIINRSDIFESIRYMLYPNFHQLTAKSFSYALGHVLFTMSLGFAAVVTLGGYLPKYSSSGTAGVRVALIDTFVSICIGVVIFPVISLTRYEGAMSEALFRAIPNFIRQEALSPFFALGFYICIFIASINASIGLVETILYKTNDSFKWGREKASVYLYLMTVVFSALIIFLNTKDVGVYFGRSFLEQIDDVAINFILPLAAIVISFVTLKCVDKEFLKSEFDVEDKIENVKIYKSWRVFLFFIMPSVYFICIGMRFF
jgi:NSS family neurotransmitter:Na+ symporter